MQNAHQEMQHCDTSFSHRFTQTYHLFDIGTLVLLRRETMTQSCLACCWHSLISNQPTNTSSVATLALWSQLLFLLLLFLVSHNFMLTSVLNRMYKLLNLKPTNQRQASGSSGIPGLAHPSESLSESLTAVMVAISLKPQLKTCFFVLISFP